jgi:hypothetical protein
MKANSRKHFSNIFGQQLEQKEEKVSQRQRNQPRHKKIQLG